MTSKSPFEIKWPLAGFWHHLSTDIFERFWPLNHDWLILALEQGDYKWVPDSSQNSFFCRKWAICAGQAAVWIFAKVSSDFFFNIFIGKSIWVSAHFKGQLISEWIYEVIVSPKVWTKHCKNFCPLLLIPQYSKVPNKWIYVPF